MPFERYIGQPRPVADNPSYEQYSHDHSLPVDPNTFSSNVQFQLPQLMLGAPTLAPGGGAEVLPAGLFGPTGPLTSSWFNNSYSNDFSANATKERLSPTKCCSSLLPAHSPPQPASHSPDLHFLPPDISSSLPFPTSGPGPSLGPSPVNIPSALGLPVYSASGFDLLSILSRITTRPNQRIVLGPVDLTCSFVVVDVRRFDSPIVYASPTFCKLTGYDEHEVLGRNCRFLQSPDGRLQRGDLRRYTAPEAVAHLKKSLAAGKECQTSLINYRKGGAAFINLVTVIPIRGGINNSPEEQDDIVYHVGFQVDLTEQPNAILRKLRDGSYIVNYSSKLAVPDSLSATFPRDWRANSAMMRGVSKDLRALLDDSSFINSIPIHASTTASSAQAAANTNPGEPGTMSDPYDGNKPLHMLLLESTPDFIHVVSLKGAFLYVAPAVRRVLGYDPDDLVGRSLTEFCHAADIVPLMRELKEASATPMAASGSTLSSGRTSPSPGGAPSDDSLPSMQSATSTAGPRAVDLLFRMRAKAGDFVWVECRGRLHVEPGKGRKAIILSGRVRSMPRLEWGPVQRAGGLTAVATATESDGQEREREQEVWGLLSTNGTFLFVGAAVRDVLGWGAGEVIGRTVGDFIGGRTQADARKAVEQLLAGAFAESGVELHGVGCEMRRKDGSGVTVHVAMYRSHGGAGKPPSSVPTAPHPVVCQIKLLDAHATAPRASWQYELQQLKYANQRLQEEVAALEAGVASRAQRQSLAYTAPPPPPPLAHAHSVPAHVHAQVHAEYDPARGGLWRQPVAHAPLVRLGVAGLERTVRARAGAGRPGPERPPAAHEYPPHEAIVGRGGRWRRPDLIARRAPCCVYIRFSLSLYPIGAQLDNILGVG
ncbi:White collar 1 protein [Grifola frondosa]|uniref:White collar 1 protein n=1 Tax=Grifola frondosa TaxID=5627 RepID=A0A1C7LM57_GRIFR|nr:White collar 1 protein [Grifola frondosa]